MSSGERPQGEARATKAEPPKDLEDDLGTRVVAGPFTRYVQDWEPGREPEPVLASAMWSAFGRVVRQELRRRSLSQTSPQWLGIYGFRGWWEVTGRGGPFEDLLAEAYRYVFVDRFAALKAQTRAKANIEGVVLASVRNFLHDRQGCTTVSAPACSRCCPSRCAAPWRAGISPSSPAPRRSEAPRSWRSAGGTPPSRPRPETLATIVRQWNDELLPDLVTASRADKRRLIEELTSRLAELELAGVTAFRFGDLITPLKADVRERWAALLAPAEEEPTDDEDARGFRRLRRSFEPAVRSPGDRSGPVRQADRLC